MDAKQIVDPNTVLYDSVTATRSGKDEEHPKFGVGQKVKLVKDVVNDGTYPHAPIGTLMMKEGSIGYIKSIGEFLQVIRVYEVFLMPNKNALHVLHYHLLQKMQQFSLIGQFPHSPFLK